MSWVQERRLDFIDWHLATYGEINRDDIMKVFGVSRPQASQDISDFTRLYPRAMQYDKSLKRYIKSGKLYRHYAVDERKRLIYVLG